jgi:opacity protein-like surface antigen
MKTNGVAKVAVAAGLFSAALAQSACSSVLVPTYTAPAVASGWQAQLVAGGLKKPRSIQFDSAGALLIVDSGKGVLRYTFTDNGDTCLQVDKQQLLIDQTAVSLRFKDHVLSISQLLTAPGPAVEPWPCSFSRRQYALCLFGRVGVRMGL